MKNNQWIGIATEKMMPYKHYVNYDGTCGILASAVLLSYYQDNIDPFLFSHEIRQPHQHNHQKLIETLSKEITTFLPKGLSLFDVTIGLNRFLRKYGTNPTIKTTAHCLVGSALGPMRAHAKMSEPTPIIYSTLAILNAPTNYKNHFLVGYAYQNKQLLSHDNHGSVDAVIQSNWTFGSISLSQKRKK